MVSVRVEGGGGGGTKKEQHGERRVLEHERVGESRVFK